MSSFFIFQFQQKMGTEALFTDDVMKNLRPVSDPTPRGLVIADGVAHFLTLSLTMSDDASDKTRLDTCELLAW